MSRFNNKIHDTKKYKYDDVIINKQFDESVLLFSTFKRIIIEKKERHESIIGINKPYNFDIDLLVTYLL